MGVEDREDSFVASGGVPLTVGGGGLSVSGGPQARSTAAPKHAPMASEVVSIDRQSVHMMFCPPQLRVLIDQGDAYQGDACDGQRRGASPAISVPPA